MTPASFMDGVKASFSDSGVVQTFASNRSIETRLEAAFGKVQKEGGWNPYEDIKNSGPKYENYFDILK